MRYLRVIAAIFVASLLPAQANPQEASVVREDGYRGIWYMNQPTGDEYAYKYSGGLGTYCAKHIPMAVHAEKADKTFFVYGGRPKDKNTLLEMVSYFDHKTGEVPRPVVLIAKGTDDAHDNPVLAIDDDGHIWVFASSHGTARPSYIFKSTKPYDISGFEQVLKTNFSYPQPWWISGQGFLFLHTYYKAGRGLYLQTSKDGVEWSERTPLAHMEEGHYQVSWPRGNRVGTAFDYHPTAFQGDPKKKGLNWRTNLYYIETDDMGKTWRTAAGEVVPTPLTDKGGPARVVEYESQGLLCYVKDVNYDAEGRPVILYVTARSWNPGPEGDPRQWRTAHWSGSAWDIRDVTRSDNNYDSGSLYIESDSAWRVIGPTETGPQAYNPGGEMAMWLSRDEGVTWTKERQLTSDSAYNHTYARRPLNANPGFYAFWADGNARKPSDSRLYFCDKEGKVYRLPETMESDFAKPIPVE
jgi:hypothetical protein